MFCDQDDVWYHDKVEKTFRKMIELEEEFGKTTPCLVHTDLTVVDEKLNEISPSFFSHLLFGQFNHDYNRLLVRPA